MQWSIEEQTIPTNSFMGDHHPHLASINMRVDPSSSHVMIMELRGEPDAEGRVGYVLKFNKGGEFLNAELITAPPPSAAAEAAPAHHAAPSKKR